MAGINVSDMEAAKQISDFEKLNEEKKGRVVFVITRDNAAHFKSYFLMSVLCFVLVSYSSREVNWIYFSILLLCFICSSPA